jgi:hypothetical protein
MVTFEDEASVLRFDEGEASRNAGEDCAHAPSDDLLECFDEREFFLIECGVFGDYEDDVGRMPFLQLDCDVVDQEFVAGRNGEAILGIKVCEVRELVGELAAQARVGENFPATIALAALHEGRDECMLVVHPSRVAQNPERPATGKLCSTTRNHPVFKKV